MASADPITEFLNAVERAKAHQVDTTPVVLATADSSGRPAARLVLLRGADSRGFVFFTNYDSRKGRELTENPHAALCFYWASLDEQIRIEGDVSRVSPAESDTYFAGRPRGSQLGAWASMQSETLDSRETFDKRLADIATRFEDQAVPRPPRWTGFRVVPRAVEFWYGGAYRLHERYLHEVRGDGTWSTRMLYP